MTAKRLTRQFDISLRKGFHRLRQSLYRITKETSGAPWPASLALPLTAQCNYNCGFCEIVGVKSMLRSENLPYHANCLSVDHVLQFSTLIKRAFSIDFGGMTGLGEPLLSPHFQAILQAIRRLNRSARLNLTTNAGLLSPKISDMLIKYAPLSVTFSVHGASAEVYGRIMGTDFDKVVENIGYFCNRAKGIPDIDTCINFGVGKLNHVDSGAIVLLAKKLGINSLNMYLYYKSPNRFNEDVSLYSNPVLANQTLKTAYQTARSVGLRMIPIQPAYLHNHHIAKSPDQKPYGGGCPFPFDNFILKSNPLQKDKMAFCVCNRIVLFSVSLNMQVSEEDISWMWNHPALGALRFPADSVPEICRFCKDSTTPSLRSQRYEEYKQQRDKAVREYLSKWQHCKVSPGGSIELLSENIFSVG